MRWAPSWPGWAAVPDFTSPGTRAWWGSKYEALTSKGVAGVPRASLVVIAGTIATFNIPEAGLALLIGIDPLVDMGRSATNVLGNAMATAVVSKWEDPLTP